LIYNSNRFKRDEYCIGCFFNADFCLAPGNTTTKLPCDPVDRLHDSMKPKNGITELPEHLKSNYTPKRITITKHRHELINTKHLKDI